MPILDIKITALEVLKPLTTRSFTKSNLTVSTWEYSMILSRSFLQIIAENQNFPQMTRIRLENWHLRSRINLWCKVDPRFPVSFRSSSRLACAVKYVPHMIQNILLRRNRIRHTFQFYQIPSQHKMCSTEFWDYIVMKKQCSRRIVYSKNRPYSSVKYFF